MVIRGETLKRRQFTVEFKLNAVKLLELNQNNLWKTANLLNLDRKTLRLWRKQKVSFILCNNKRYRKKIGCGRRCSFPILERHLVFFINSERRLFKRIITRRRLLEKAREFSRLYSINFIGTYSWISSFLKRNNFCFRKITHVGQQDNDSFEQIRNKILEHIRYLSFWTKHLESDQIYNMDETPGFFDMVSPTTITFKGEKNVEVLATGHTHSRFTIVLCIRLDGFISKTMIIFKGLKRIPKLNLPDNIIVDVSDGGSMNQRIMINWLDNCFQYQSKKSLLIMDNFGSHTVNCVVDKMKELNTNLFLLPPRTTHYTQPLDVGINGPFKTALRNEWENWFSSSTPVLTKKGYRKGPTYQSIVDFVHKALGTINRTKIFNSFTSCENSKYVSSLLLNDRLQKIVNNHNDSELSLSYELDYE